MRALTRVTAAALLAALLLFAAPVLAAGGAADPLVTLSSAERWAEGVLSDAKDGVSSALAGNGFRMLADAIASDLPYPIDCPALLLCGAVAVAFGAFKRRG